MKSILCLLLALVSFNPVSYGISRDQDKFKVNPTADPRSKDKIYVPTNLEDAFIELKKMLSPELLKEIKEGSEQNMIQYHMSLGLWMRNNWSLWAGSRLGEYFNGIGIFHPDDMSGIVLQSFWRHLNARPIRLEEQVAYYQRFWKVNAEPKKKNCPLDGSEIEITMTLDESEADQPKAIHVGRCKKRKHLWAYEYDKGWYRPDSALRKKIVEDE
jgi:hypothetical protein